MSAETAREAAQRIVEASCAAQGIKAKVTDPVVLDRTVKLLRAGRSVAVRPARSA